VHSPELEAIVAADRLDLIAIRALPGAWSPKSIDRLSAADSTTEDTLWRLASDRDRRRSALFHAARSGWQGPVHVQIMAASAEDCEVCSMALVADARAAGIKPDRIVLEMSETEEVDDPAKLALATALWRSLGFRTATRHFGGGLSGLAMLLRLEPDLVCLDGDWIRRVAVDAGTRIIVAGVVNTCRELGCEVLADGVVSERLSQALADLGIRNQSGPLFAHLTKALGGD
jgi:EAL domain-containing protein (putative c-di-GMP-specific phosphodiesterase class I)